MNGLSETIWWQRFWARTHVHESGCWLWLGPKNSRTGYGQAKFRGQTMYPHRLAYEAIKGPIPSGLELDHLCRIRDCLNPEHLEAVTPRENTLRSPVAIAAINARKTHCPAGHAYDEANIIWLNDGRGRACRACKRAKDIRRGLVRRRH